MIAGIGIDIVEIKRVREAVARHPNSFPEKVFTASEIEAAAAKAEPSSFYAGRWAAKEALAKALGCGIGPHCRWLDINIANDSAGQPHISLAGSTARFADTTGVETIHLSISHEKNYACAVVVLEK